MSELFASFDPVPLASASIAQVHAARLPGGREVVVKVLRPDIEKQIDGDIALPGSIAALVERAHPNADKIRPREIVREVETTLAAELDLQREGAKVNTVEHLMSALAGLGVDNAHIDVDAAEIPIHDGSAGPFVFLIQSSPNRFFSNSTMSSKATSENAGSRVLILSNPLGTFQPGTRPSSQDVIPYTTNR